GQHRSTQRREPLRAADDAALRARLRKISHDRPRWGYRRAHALLREEGWCLNRKRTQRLWREEGLRVPQRRRKRQRLGESTVPADRLAAGRPDQVWALDFQFDQTADGRILKLLHVVDEFTREALAIKCERRIDSDATVAVLEGLVGARGTAPEHIRCDNGPELTANALRDWCRFSKAGSAYIDPGSPWQNPYVESFGSRVRDELLSGELFETLLEAQVMVSDWRDDYNERRPHSALGMSAPASFAKAWREDAENGRPITCAGAAQARRAPQDAPISGAEDQIGADQAKRAPAAVPVVPLRSPSGLAPRDEESTTLQAQTNHRLSQRVDR
ncbi:MAG: IS3 family transposase, partial [Actinobacteria bacterium]|nr:IS3 family transposase [Actinomycetota bacterium]